MSAERTVLVTGAGGFIGGSIVEALHLGSAYRVRAGIHSWQSAARIGRFPVEMVPCDILAPDSIASALEGVRYVVHCAYGDRRATVEGTERMLAGALAAGVDRFVHMSTVEVYGDADGEVDESRPYKYTGRPYGDSKIDAEKVCWAYTQRGLPLTVLRPTIVYGPFSKLWSVRVAERLQSKRFAGVQAHAQGRCNLLYIDDLVAMIENVLQNDDGVGEALNVNGSDRPTWNEYFDAFAAVVGRGPLKGSQARTFALGAKAMEPARAVAKLILARYQGPVMKIYARSALAKTAIRRAEKMIKTTPTVAELALYGRDTVYAIDKATSRLGYRPRYDMRRGLDLTARWLEHEGLIAERGQAPTAEVASS